MTTVHRSGSDGAWSRFSVLLVRTAAFLFLALAALVLILDPYDTGRPGLFPRTGIREQAAVTANASRARDTTFNAAILGNSHAQAIRPDRLSALTGLSFVTLIMPGSRPRDQIAVLEWYLAHRGADARALVIGLDAWWCTDETPPPTSGRFPSWLYSPAFAEYVGGMIRYRSLEEAAAHLRYLVGAERPARPDGFDDYEPVYVSLGAGDPAAVERKLERPIALFAPNTAGRFPSLDRLRESLRRAPTGLEVILLWPPIFPTGLPRAGSDEDRARNACRAAAADVAGSRPGMRVVDWADRPEAAFPSHYFNHDHYKDILAQLVERSLVSDPHAGQRPER